MFLKFRYTNIPHLLRSAYNVQLVDNTNASSPMSNSFWNGFFVLTGIMPEISSSVQWLISDNSLIRENVNAIFYETRMFFIDFKSSEKNIFGKTFYFYYTHYHIIFELHFYLCCSFCCMINKGKTTKCKQFCRVILSVNLRQIFILITIFTYFTVFV